MQRSIPFYTQRIVPEAVNKGKCVLVNRHKNAIRGILWCVFCAWTHICVLCSFYLLVLMWDSWGSNESTPLAKWYVVDIKLMYFVSVYLTLTTFCFTTVYFTRCSTRLQRQKEMYHSTRWRKWPGSYDKVWLWSCCSISFPSLWTWRRLFWAGEYD